MAELPDDVVTLDAAALRILAHPMRLTLLGRLRQHGPATARQLAAMYDIDSGAASYHLRRLAEGGLIEEDTALGSRRDRWWRARHRTSVHEPLTAASDEQQDSRAYVHATALAYSERLRRLADTVPLLPDDWFAASTFSDYTLRLTPGELTRLKRELASVIHKYSADAADGSGTPVSVQLQAFPLLEPDSEG